MFLGRADVGQTFADIAGAGRIEAIKRELKRLKSVERPKNVQPAPRWPDGRINIASVPGQKGHWIRTRRELVVDANTKDTLPNDRRIDEIPFQPWAKARETA